jgi:hypothetical protein
MAISLDAATSMHTVISSDHECCPAGNNGELHVSASCCTVHHQPATATSATDLNPSLEMMHANLSAALLAAATIAPPSGGKTSPPLRRPATKLRI